MAHKSASLNSHLNSKDKKMYEENNDKLCVSKMQHKIHLHFILYFDSKF